MRKILLISLLILGLHQAPARCGDIVVLQSGRLEAYNSAFQGFADTVAREIPAQGLKAIQPHTITTHILSEAENLNILRKQVLRQHPDLILVIGSSSLSLVKGITHIPIIYLMVPYPEVIVSGQGNITGISIHISPARQLEALVRKIPGIKKIGLLYNPEQAGSLVKEAEEFGARAGLTLLARPVDYARDVPARLADLADRIDCFWMLPDRTVITPQTVDAILLFSLENRIPVLTFSEKYLDMGATVSVSFDPNDMGNQAGELALEIINGTESANRPPVPVRKINVRVNSIAAKLLGLTVNDLNDRK